MRSAELTLEKLYEYDGTNPKPNDFENYWEKALDELSCQSLDYTLEKVESSFKDVLLYHMYFTGVANARIHCRLLVPAKGDKKFPALANFHGYTMNCGDWYDKLPFVYNGFVVAAMDVRGQSGLSQDTLQTMGSTLHGHIVKGVDDEDPHNLMYRNIYLDTVQLIRILKTMPFVDSERIGAYGASQGGGLTLACAALEPSVKAISSCYPFLCDYMRVWDLHQAHINTAYLELHSYFRRKDPMHERETEFWTRLGYIDNQYLAPRIRANTLMFCGLDDTVCPPSTQFAAYNRITSPKQVLIYPEYGHEMLPGQAEKTLLFFLKEL